MSQITFEFSFQVGKLQASLYKATAAGEEKTLAVAALEGFGLTFALRKYDMSVDLHLQNITLAMVEQGEIRKPLLSAAETDTSAPSADRKLVKVKYMKVQKDSPEFMTKHDGIDQSVVAELSSFKITVAPEPILALNDFIMTTFVPQDEQPVATVQKAGEAEVVPTATPSSDKIRVRVHLSSAQGKSYYHAFANGSIA
jgi:vacuolar protein sorting-associated protein 13A/C